MSHELISTAPENVGNLSSDRPMDTRWLLKKKHWSEPEKDFLYDYAALDPVFAQKLAERQGVCCGYSAKILQKHYGDTMEAIRLGRRELKESEARKAKLALSENSAH